MKWLALFSICSTGYSPINGGPPTPYSDEPGVSYTGGRESYLYTGQKLTRREWRPYTYDDPGTRGLYAVSTYSYNGAGDLTQEQHIDYTNNTTSTLSYDWKWQAGAYRLTNFRPAPQVTTPG